MPAIEGVYAAALTPRRLGTQDINLGLAWELIDFLSEREVDGIVLLGSTGEFVHFSNAERMRVMGLAPKRSRVPVLVNVSHSTLDGAIELAQAAMASGAAGVLLMPPYFFRYDSGSVEQFFRRFRKDAGLTIPVLLYNIPQFTNPIEISLATRLLAEGVVDGVKDSSGDEANLRALLDLRSTRPFPLMLGSDGLFAAGRAAGASGAVSGIASVLPELIKAIDHAVSAGGNLEWLQARLLEFIAWIDRLPVPVGLREAGCVRGLKLGPHAVPLSPEEDRIAGEFREWFTDWLPAVLDGSKRTA